MLRPIVVDLLGRRLDPGPGPTHPFNDATREGDKQCVGIDQVGRVEEGQGRRGGLRKPFGIDRDAVRLTRRRVAQPLEPGAGVNQREVDVEEHRRRTGHDF